MDTLRAVLPRRVLPPLWREARAIAEGLEVIRHGPRPPLRAWPRTRRQVLLIPGFLVGDASMRLLADFLLRAGYDTVKSGIATNIDCSEVTVRRLETLLERRCQPGQRFAIVGHSRGGILARALARRRPDLVAGIVTLGSPLRDQLAVHPMLWANIFGVALAGTAGIGSLLSLKCATGSCCEAFRGDLERRVSSSVKVLSVYSRRDGLVDWRSCIDRDGENVEVSASHIGMIANASTFRVVLAALDRLPPEIAPPEMVGTAVTGMPARALARWAGVPTADSAA